MSPSPFQRFIQELRRRHVPQTAAIYLVAAWAAIEFADVVVPNLNGPQWVVTAVIVAALVGLPVMLVVAWVFEWGPEGLHRTAEEADRPGDGGELGEIGVTSSTASSWRPQPWTAALAVLVVAIGSAVAVTFMLRAGEPGEAAAPAPDTLEARDTQSTTVRGPDAPGLVPPVPPRDLPEAYGEATAESIQARVVRTFGALDSLDFSELAELGRRMAARVGNEVVIEEPEAWQLGGPQTPVPLAEGDTLVVEGVALDTAGVAAVMVDGETVAEADPPEPTLAFTAALVGTGSVGMRRVVIAIRTGDGRQLQTEYRISQLPGGTP